MMHYNALAANTCDVCANPAALQYLPSDPGLKRLKILTCLLMMTPLSAAKSTAALAEVA
jgi:hypothetical protein